MSWWKLEQLNLELFLKLNFMWWRLFGTMDIKDETNFDKCVRLAGEYLIEPKTLNNILHELDDFITFLYKTFEDMLNGFAWLLRFLEPAFEYIVENILFLVQFYEGNYAELILILCPPFFFFITRFQKKPFEFSFKQDRRDYKFLKAFNLMYYYSIPNSIASVLKKRLNLLALISYLAILYFILL
jgi:hypothetical protein